MIETIQVAIRRRRSLWIISAGALLIAFSAATYGGRLASERESVSSEILARESSARSARAEETKRQKAAKDVDAVIEHLRALPRPDSLAAASADLQRRSSHAGLRAVTANSAEYTAGVATLRLSARTSYQGLRAFVLDLESSSSPLVIKSLRYDGEILAIEIETLLGENA